MPFNIGETINYLVDGVLQTPPARTIARNPIYIGLLTTLVIMLLILFVFRDADTDESLMIMSARVGFWVFLFMMGVLVINNRVIMRDKSAARADKAFNGVFSAPPPSELDDDVIVSIPHPSTME